MNKEKAKIYIIGAGISGLIASKTLEENGYAPTLLEATDSPGGRVKTDSFDGVLYDHGFQVLLTAYPQAQKHLDYKALELYQFQPGALIFKNGKTERIGDPLRDRSAFWPTVRASVGSLYDKFKIFTLTRKLKSKSVTDIFTAPEKTTLNYLKAYGFSDRIISNFFKPFFTGIFLEEELNTSSRLFEFVFKMFGEGYAAIPKVGIGAISEQLAGGLHKSTFSYKSQVAAVNQGDIVLKNGTSVATDAVISTIPINSETGKVASQNVKWKNCDNLYFTVSKRVFEEGIIGLLAAENTYTNNLYYPFGQSLNSDPILSVTVVKRHAMTDEALAKKVQEELQQHCGITIKNFLRNYTIQQALPDISNLRMDASTSNTLKNGVFIAGDYTLSGSLNAAMLSGEAAAKAVIKKLQSS